MRNSTSIWLLFSLVALLVPARVPAALQEDEPPLFSTLNLVSEAFSDGPVTLRVQVGVAEDLDASIAGLVVRRVVLGQCGDVAITSSPLAWPAAGNYEFEVLDSISPQSVHHYWIEAVDAQGDQVSIAPFQVVERVVGYVHRGADLIVGRGQLFRTASEAVLLPCFDGCWPSLLVNSNESVQRFVDTGEQVVLRGIVDCKDPRGCRIDATAEPGGCAAVPTAADSWGAVKARY